MTNSVGLLKDKKDVISNFWGVLIYMPDDCPHKMFG